MKNVKVETTMPIECKGKNGYFKFDSFNVWEDHTGQMWVEVFSKARGPKWHAPVVFKGSREDLFAFFFKIMHTIETM